MPRYSPRKRYPQRRPYTHNVQEIRNPEAPATEKQTNYLRALARDRDCQMSPEDASMMIDLWDETGALTKGFVSGKIEEFKALPPRQKQGGAEPGYYITAQGSMYVVVKTRDGERTYAKRLEQSSTGHWSWEYAKGASRILANFKPMTEEEAAAWGHLHGRCFKCLRPLTDPESVKRGMGPICAKALKR